jgi:hypothetical protein
MRPRAFASLLGFCLAFAPCSARTQQADSVQRVRAFLDCEVSGCDSDYFRREIQFVDHMRDRADASVHVLVTAVPTGSGGTAYTVNFIGLREFGGLADTLRFSVPQTATTDERRTKLARYLELGLARFVARAGDADGLSVSYSAPVAAGAKTATSADRWNYWVFRTRVNANFNGEQSQRSAWFSGSQSANRITPRWKTQITLNQSYNENKFDFEDGSSFASYSRSYGLRELVVKSVTPHFSAGQRSSINTSTFFNEKLVARFGPAVEYDLFPYDESSRRQLTFQYSVGATFFKYQDTTIFDKISETRPDQSLIVALGLTQPWGSVSTSLTGASYLDDFTKNRVELFTSADVRLFKGLSLNVFVSASRLRDQLYLAKGGATEQEVLVRRRQLATSYSYFGGFGLSYTFGSIFNNIVNTRFDGPNGGNFIFF